MSKTNWVVDNDSSVLRTIHKNAAKDMEVLKVSAAVESLKVALEHSPELRETLKALLEDLLED